MTNRLLLIAGLIGPIIFVAAVLVGAALTPGYSHVVNAVSELSQRGAPHALLVGTLFSISAVLELLFGIGVMRVGNDSRQLRWCGCLVAAYAVMALLLAAVFPMDPIGFPVTVSGILHLVLVGTSAFSLVAAVLLGGSGMRSDLGGGFLWYSMLSVILMLLGGAATPLLISRGIEMLGLAERVTQIAYLQWLFVFAIVILRWTSRK